MRAMSSTGRRYGVLIASAALSLAGCMEDAAPPPLPADRALPTAAADLAPIATPIATPIVRDAPADAQVPEVARAGGALRIEPGAVELQSGHAYWVRLPDAWLPVASDMEHPQRSTVVVEEDGVALAPGNTPLETVQKVGRGSFLHWGVWLYFSTSDNTDPRTNGRTYHVVLPRTE